MHLRPRSGHDRPAAIWRRCAGYTIVELVVTLLIIAILTAIALPYFAEYRNRAKTIAAQGDIYHAEAVIELYFGTNHSLPSSISDLQGIATIDPWGRPYVYYNIEVNGKGHARKDHALNPLNTDYDFYSVGADGLTKSRSHRPIASTTSFGPATAATSVWRRGSDYVSRLSRISHAFGSRLEWRLLAIFLAAALLPLAASDWISTSVIGGIGQQLTHDRDSLATRAAARQVFERLIVSRAWLRAIDESGLPARTSLMVDAVGAGSPFSAVACSDGDAQKYSQLHAAWELMRTGEAMPSGSPGNMKMRVSRGGGGQDAALMMASTRVEPPPCIALLNPEFVWEAVHDSADDSAWLVRDGDGNVIVHWEGADALEHATQRPDQLDLFSTHLFLSSEFGASNWTIEQRMPRRRVDWHGIPVTTWLLSVAAATLLVIGLAAHRTIRRTLRPLEALTEGSRRLAAGVAPTRVDVRRDDELGRLAKSFNDMAAQLEDRIASLHALAQVDAGILGGAEFGQLARGVLGRLVELQPQAQAFVVWQDDSGALLAIDHSEATGGLRDDDVQRIEISSLQRQIFEGLEDGVYPTSIVNDLGVQATRASPCGLVTQCLVLGIREGAPNQAMMIIELADEKFDTQHALDLRDRLTVAVVARNRAHQLEYHATRDQLTGLLNRYGLQLDFERLLASNTVLAVLFIDLDHFKDINDCYGHVVGDRLLQAAARRLQRAVPPDTLLSRNGGDEFVVVVPGADAATAATLGNAILAALRPPFIIATTEHRCSASIGVALFPDHGLDRDDLIRCADIALYESKNDGRDRVTLFRAALDTKIRERNDLLSGLDRALKRSEFVVYYQPRLDACTGHVVAAEALVRWQHPERGLTLPGVFVDLAESSGMIDSLGLFVMETAIAQLQEWHRAGMPIKRISVNVSQQQFTSGDLAANVADMLLRSGVPGSLLEIEVTESVLSGDIDSVRRQLHDLRRLGISIAMDDFGTGYSSLSLLRTLPIDVMKIDRAFVKDLETHSDAVAIARTIVTLARALELDIVAEGIETQAQADILRAMGCDQFQGFLYSRAVPALEFAELARQPFVHGRLPPS